jgi:hypothetical protein
MNQQDEERDEGVERLKEARYISAAAKLRLISLRNRFPSILVFAFEGDDDKIIYRQWITRLFSELSYEALSCGGKRNVLALRDSLSRDEAGLGKGVYYFVDRDYDDLQGREAGDDIFMTDYYSVENYLVTEAVLENILKTEMDFNLRPELRKCVLNIFLSVFEEFLSRFSVVNFRIFLARRERLEIIDEKESLKKLWLDVSLQEIGPFRKPPEEIVRLIGQISEKEKEVYKQGFDQLDPATRHRGKFMLAFFRKWLESLDAECRKPQTDILHGHEDIRGGRTNEFTLGMFASKSAIPAGLYAFLQAGPLRDGS